MPMHKRESLIYTIMMCFTMVLWMSIYNVTLHMGILNVETIKEAWLGFPIAYVFAMLCDWFVVSGPAKGFAFRFLVNPDSSTMKKSDCSILLYGSSDGNYHVVLWRNGSMREIRRVECTANHLADQYSEELYYGVAFQLIVAGPLVRKVFRTHFQ